MIPDADLRLLRLTSAGMFSNVNLVIESAYRADRDGYVFYIDWPNSRYSKDGGNKNAWEIFFEQSFAIPQDISVEDLPRLPAGPRVNCTLDNIVTPHVIEGDWRTLLPPRDRAGANRIIEKYIKPTPLIQDEIDRFLESYNNKPYVGLHIRGPERNSEVMTLRGGFWLQNGVPLNLYFRNLEKVLKETGIHHVLVCSDSNTIIREAQKKFGARVLTYEASRSDTGGMHKSNDDQYDQIKLGVDVIVEAYLLSQSKVLVHGNSNIVNFALCKNADMRSIYVYENVEHDPRKFPGIKAFLYRNTRTVIHKLRWMLSRLKHASFPRGTAK